MPDVKLKMETAVAVSMDRRSIRTCSWRLSQIFTLSVLQHQHEEKASRRWEPLSLWSQTYHPVVNGDVGWCQVHVRRWHRWDVIISPLILISQRQQPNSLLLIWDWVLIESEKEENLSLIRLQTKVPPSSNLIQICDLSLDGCFFFLTWSLKYLLLHYFTF